MKKVDELLAIVDDIAPNIKSSERLLLVSIMQDQWIEGFDEASKMALDRIEEKDDDIAFLTDENWTPKDDKFEEPFPSFAEQAVEDERIQERKEDEEHYGDHSDQEHDMAKSKMTSGQYAQFLKGKR